MPAEVVPVQQELALFRRRDGLAGFAVGLAEGGAQRFVAVDEPVECLFERGQVECAGQPEAACNVVGDTVGFHLRQEPEPLLGERQRQRLAAVGLRDGFLRGGCALLQAGGEVGQHRAGKHIGQGNFNRQRLPEPGQQLHGQQRMAAEGEEVVLPPDPFDLEERRPEFCDGLFGGALRCLVALAGIGIGLRRGQGLAVEFAVGG